MPVLREQRTGGLTDRAGPTTTCCSMVMSPCGCRIGNESGALVDDASPFRRDKARALLAFVATALDLRHDGPVAHAPRTARALARAELTRAILDRAGDQLAEVGPAALSVRQVARELEMASSAVYRYFPSRDALLTALIVQGYDDLGGRVEAADAGVRRRSRFDLRWTAVAHAVRDWARAQPHRYALLYGSPVPGYAAPDDTVPAATRVTVTLVRIIAEAEAAGVHAGLAGPGHEGGAGGDRQHPLVRRARARRRDGRAWTDRLGRHCSAISRSSCSVTCTAASSTTTPTSPRSWTSSRPTSGCV